MTREEHLKFCRTCSNRKLDLKQGLICQKTGEIAAFDPECPDYDLDESVKTPSFEAQEELAIDGQLASVPPEILERLRLEQNLPFAFIGGSLASIAGAVLWASVTLSTNLKIGYVAIAIGAMVGFTIKYMGKGIDKSFGFLGAVLALLGCILGNFLCIVAFVANDEGLGYFETLAMVDIAYIPEIMVETFSPMDIVFYGIAVYEGFKFSFRNISAADLERVAGRNINLG